jgi:hypothetical protein
MTDKPKEGDTRVYKEKLYTTYRKLINGEWVLHREDGYAFETVKQTDELSGYFINGQPLTKEQFFARTSKLGKILYD